MNNGWVKLHRKFTDWEWFNISEMVHLFIYLVLNANHEDNIWRGVLIKRGQILTGLNSLHQKTKISNQTLRTCLKRLEKTQEINIQSTNQYSIITICKYDDYQIEQQTTNKRPNKRLTSDQQTTNKQLTTNKNDKNVKNEIKYNEFYDEQILLSTNDEKYINFVEVLFGKNNLKMPLNGVLSLKNQVTYQQFQLIYSEKVKNNVSLTTTLENLENRPDLLKKYSLLQRVILNWIKPKK